LPARYANTGGLFLFAAHLVGFVAGRAWGGQIMASSDNLIGAAVLLVSLLVAGCGGGGVALSDRQAGQGGAAGDPSGSMPKTADFVAMAQAATCANQTNRLFMIDKKMMFWDRAGNCADNSYGRTLFGATPQQALCSVSDSIAGPKSSCGDESSRPMFATITANLDKSDLGLGGAHQVEPIAIPPH
jgi:hypothetical protein